MDDIDSTKCPFVIHEMPNMPGYRLLRLDGNITEESSSQLEASLEQTAKTNCRGLVVDCANLSTRAIWFFVIVVRWARKWHLRKHDVIFAGLNGDARIAFFLGDYGFEVGFDADIDEAAKQIKAFQTSTHRTSSTLPSYSTIQNNLENDIRSGAAAEEIEKRRKDGF
jgi:hypothetical protein